MSYKKSLVKFAIKKTPKKMIFWVANKKAKGIAKLTDFRFNSKERKLYAQLLLSGEEKKVELWLEDFTLTTHKQSFQLVIHQIQSNRPWLDCLLKNFVLEREWKVPDKHADLIHYLLALDNSGQEESSE
ncbi:MAG TPA: hypothetical protein EYQ43_08500 [Methyloprofundus sp.]|uniref:hypothetical protein n=1 Tax=Methyloprofundus sp. TaxID=2020875 RepID=UPI0017B8ED38|nr:hypothetical protein [Methyloprofundus sp.]HIG65575.1 hypothetical protein [Methyloprofundus sp.]HIL78460.1 hypothetical protein [Methylococcales bacterium]